MLLERHHSPSKRLAVVSEGVASGASPTRVLFFGDEEPSRFMFFDANVSFEDPDLYSAVDFKVVCVKPACSSGTRTRAGGWSSLRSGDVLTWSKASGLRR